MRRVRTRSPRPAPGEARTLATAAAVGLVAIGLLALLRREAADPAVLAAGGGVADGRPLLAAQGPLAGDDAPGAATAPAASAGAPGPLLVLPAVDASAPAPPTRIDEHPRPVHHRSLERIEDLVADLRDDDTTGNAQWALQCLNSRLPAARLHLAPALVSDDPQQRFLAAYLLARGGFPETRAAAAEVLIEHLADNDMSHDAEMARDALTQLSFWILPQVTAAYREATDPQARDYLARIMVGVRRSADRARPGQSAWIGANSHLPYGYVRWGWD